MQARNAMRLELNVEQLCILSTFTTVVREGLFGSTTNFDLSLRVNCYRIQVLEGPVNAVIQLLPHIASPSSPSLTQSYTQKQLLSPVSPTT